MDLRCMLRDTSKAKGLEAIAARYPEAKLEFVTVNLRNLAEIGRAVAGCEIVIHAAAALKGSPAEMFMDSVVASRNLLEAVVNEVRPIRVVLVSSFGAMGVAEMRRGAMVDESAPLDPRNAYATSKAAQEFYAANWARVTGGAVAALRYHNVYGPGMPRDTPYAGVAAIFTSALRNGQAPQVFEDGRQRRDFVHVRDVAAATVLACETHAAGVRAFNVGSGTPRSVGEMAAALAHALHGPPPVVTGHYRLGDVRHITADSSRLRGELGWCPQVDFADGMAELARL